uniref:Uncharacterized protein n=1 Tax=viral metagenome TaxID=1070528 RepID=A0A6M3LVH1_9ZZZZ
MNYRTATILAEKSLSGAGTETIDVNVRDIISRLALTWKITPSKHGMDSYPHKDITKIELVDGSDVLHSMDGGQNQALCIYDRKVPTMNYGQHQHNLSQLANFGIDFGRFLYDPGLALDPTKFRNLQLKVSYDSDVADTGVTSGNLEVRAEIFDEKIVSPIGFLMSKMHHDRTPPASGYWYVDLPTDFPLRKMLVQGYQAAYEPWYQVSEVRLDEDNEKRIPLDWELETYYRKMVGIWAAVEEGIAVKPTTGVQYYYVTPSDYWVQVMLANMTATTQIQANPVRGGKIGLTSEEISQTAVGMVRGYLPNHCFEFPFGDQMDMADWYDVTRLGNLRLRMEAGGGGASGTVAVILQQLRRYGA